MATCGNSYADVPVCCTSEQVETLQANFKQTEPLISSCPACRNNFREFFCAFTCSSGQGTFLNVSSTQNSDTNQEAVKSVEFFVGSDLGQGFYDSCKDVKFGATNGYSMDFIGGGNYGASRETYFSNGQLLQELRLISSSSNTWEMFGPAWVVRSKLISPMRRCQAIPSITQNHARVSMRTYPAVVLVLTAPQPVRSFHRSRLRLLNLLATSAHFRALASYSS